MTTIYGLSDPRTGEIRYVGKSDCPERRLKEHLDRAGKMMVNHRDHWIRQLISLDLLPQLVVLEECGEDWPNRERQWIATLPNLTNQTAGGEGVLNHSHSPETRARLREVNPRTSTTHCGNGHEYSIDNTHLTPQGHRACRQCARESMEKIRRQKGVIPRPLYVKPQKKKCKRGHLLEGENLRILVRADRVERICRECVRIRNRAAKARRRVRS